MSNPNLISKSIIDKNGKATTVHVSLGKLDPSQDTSSDRIWAKSAPPRVSSSPGSYAFTVKTRRTQKGVMLPRKRTGRDIDFDDYVVVDVPVVDPEDAPVALTIEGKEYRGFDGILYKKSKDENGEARQAEDFFAGNPAIGNDNTDSGYHDYARTPNYGQIYNDNADAYIVIDGEVWKKTNEPVYHIETSSSFSHDGIEMKIIEAHDRLSNEDTFSASERDEALARAQALLSEIPREQRAYGGGLSTWAYDRGATSIEELGNIEVSDPELIGTTYTFPTRVSYPEFSSYEAGDYDPGVDTNSVIAARMNSAMSAYRVALDSIPDAVIVQPSGAKKINWDVVPYGLKRGYENASEWALKHGYIA